MLNPWLLLGGVFLLGTGFAINAPTWASVVPQIVTDAELPSASTLNGIQLNISGILGPALAGILLARVGAPVIFGLNAVAFLLAFTAVLPRSYGVRRTDLGTEWASRWYSPHLTGRCFAFFHRYGRGADTLAAFASVISP
jgi:MFS family permease